MVATIAAFLQKSTIHGLAHLSPMSNEDRLETNLGWVSESDAVIQQGKIILIPQIIHIIRWIFWPPCIFLSLALSYIFISSNVVSWHTQPSSVSMLSPVLLKAQLLFEKICEKIETIRSFHRAPMLFSQWWPSAPNLSTLKVWPWTFSIRNFTPVMKVWSQK